MTTRNRTTARTATRPPAARSVYEIRPHQQQPVQVEATTAAELAQHLARVLALDPYGSRAAAHVLHALRAAISAPTFSVRRLGVMQFQPDDLGDDQATLTVRETVRAPRAATTADTQQLQGGADQAHDERAQGDERDPQGGQA